MSCMPSRAVVYVVDIVVILCGSLVGVSVFSIMVSD